jgi:hypothetical protein
MLTVMSEIEEASCDGDPALASPRRERPFGACAANERPLRRLRQPPQRDITGPALHRQRTLPYQGER